MWVKKLGGKQLYLLHHLACPLLQNSKQFLEGDTHLKKVDHSSLLPKHGLHALISCQRIQEKQRNNELTMLTPET